MKKYTLLAVLLFALYVGFSFVSFGNFKFAQDGNASVIDSDASGVLIGHSSCKSLLAKDGETDDEEEIVIPSTQDCIEYEYFPETKVLLLTHINAAFNCCPEVIDAKIAVENGAITIKEFEEGGFCDCNCLYDLKYKFKNIEPGTYSITVYEPYVRQGDTILQGKIDLRVALSGKFCVTREYYPWGF